MQEDTIYRCVNPACARLMPRPVKFCPWCGTAQATGQAPARDEGPAAAGSTTASMAASTAAAAMAATTASTAAATAAAAAREAVAPAGMRGASGRESWSDAPVAPPSTGIGAERGPAEREAARTDSAAATAAAGTAAARAGLAGADTRAGAGTDARSGAQAGAQAGAGAGARPDAQARARGGLGTLFGHGARTPDAQPGESVPRPPIPPRPATPQRTPIRLRWWLLVLLILWGVWMVARPNSGRKIEQRIDHAIALAQECKARDAQNELIALRKTRATDAQLERLQTALNEGAAACTRKRQRDKAWQDASSSAEAALAEQNPDRARARLQAFTRRWGEDERARALRSRIDDASHPLAAPEG